MGIYSVPHGFGHCAGAQVLDKYSTPYELGFGYWTRAKHSSPAPFGFEQCIQAQLLRMYWTYGPWSFLLAQ